VSNNPEQSEPIPLFASGNPAVSFIDINTKILLFLSEIIWKGNTITR
jgi:hypothetical protein